MVVYVQEPMLTETGVIIGIMGVHLIMDVLKLTMVQRPFLKLKIGNYEKLVALILMPTALCCNKIKYTVAVSICTRILKYRVWKIEFDELGFLSSLN